MKILALLLSLLWPTTHDDEVLRAQERGLADREQREVTVPWPMVCNFIVRLIETGPDSAVVVVAKRDCPEVLSGLR